MPTRREVLLAAGMALSGQQLPRVARSQSYPVTMRWVVCSSVLSRSCSRTFMGLPACAKA